MKRSTNKKTVYLVLFAIMISLAACNKADKNKKADTTSSDATASLVKVEPIRMQALELTKEFSGNIEPFVKNFISSQSPLRIQTIYVQVGDQVKKGQLLVQMDATNLNSTKIQLQNLKVDFSRIEALYQSGGASKQQYDQLKAQIDVLSQTIKNLEENTRLVSPINGVVTLRNFDNGDLAAGQPILQVMQLQPVKISINVSEEFYPNVNERTPVEIIADVYPNEVLRGKVSLIYPTVDPTTRTFVAQVTIDNKNSKIRPGMFARARVNFGVRDRLVVPDKAVIKQQGTNERYVYRLKGDQVEYVRIELGIRNDSVYEVLSGLAEGDQVVVAGASRLKDQAKVKVQ